MPTPFSVTLHPFLGVTVTFLLSGLIASGQEPARKPLQENHALHVFGENPMKAPKPLAEVPAELTGVIALLPQDTKGPGQNIVPFPSIFQREMARQSIWMAAHDDFGLRVLDSSLGEGVPESLPKDRQFRVQQTPFGKEHWTLTAGDHRLWAGNFTSESFGQNMGVWVDASEKRSRTFGHACLEAAGFKAIPQRKSDVPVPPAVSERLARMRETDQFAAVRMLHAEIKAKGESVALIEALSRAYANLGILTEFHWNSAPMVFKARALLYAQRLVARDHNVANAIRLRAYAFALAGAHNSALLDLDHSSKMVDKTPAPTWVEPLDAYLHFDRKRLVAMREKQDTALVRLFQFLVAEEPSTSTGMIPVGRKFLETDPEVYRVHDSFCRTHGVSHLHSATLEGTRIFRENLAERLAEQPGLPKTVGDAFKENGEAAVFSALFAAGGKDTGTPSWAALGSLLREIRFTQSVRRLDFLDRQVSMSTADLAVKEARVLSDHPLRSFIESYELSPYENPEVLRKKLLDVPVQELDLKSDVYFHRISILDGNASSRWFTGPGSRPEPLYYPQAQIVRMNTFARIAALKLGTKLRQISPHSPLANALYLAEAKPEHAMLYPELEKQFSDHAVFQRSLSERYTLLKKKDDAERCLKRWLELSPDLDGYRRLAGLYKSRGDMKQWQEALESALKTEDIGLIHAQIRVDIAETFMARKEFKKAEPYALAAARTSAEWALHCYAHCKVGLGEYDQANYVFKQTSERYPSNSPIEWYLACKACGKMDIDAAEEAVEDVLARTGDRLPANLAMRAGMYYLVSGKPKKALAAFERENALQPYGLSWMYTAFTADMLKDEKTRTAAFQQLDPVRDAGNKVLADAMMEWMKNAEPPTEEAFKPVLAKLSPGAQVDFELYIGWYLQNRGFTGRAVVHWNRCKDAPNATPFFRMLAECMIREHSSKDPKTPGKP
jgi:tetratricopeptide (TPR) repeat protein